MTPTRSSVRTDPGVTTRIINPLLEAVSETFDLMLGCQAKRQTLIIRPFESELFDISAVIGITGSAKGAICLSFPCDTALALVSDFADINASHLTPEVADAVGELVNIVAGSTKSKWDIGLNMGLPNVVHGKHHRVEFPIDSQPMRLIYSSGKGPFLVDFGFVVRDF